MPPPPPSPVTQQGKGDGKGGKGRAATGEDEPARKKLAAVQTSSAEVEACIANAVLRSGGKLSRTDFDGRHVSFLQELPVATAEAACAEFAGYHKLGELRQKGSYFMGILRRHASGEAAPPPKLLANDGRGGKGAKGGKGGMGGKGGKGGKGEKEGPCYAFTRGECARGNTCRFSH